MKTKRPKYRWGLLFLVVTLPLRAQQAAPSAALRLTL